MNNTTSGLLGFVFGAAAGAGAAYFATRRYMSLRIMDIAEQIIDMRLAEMEEQGLVTFNYEEDKDEAESEDSTDEDPQMRTISSLSKDYRSNAPTEIDYTKYYNKKDPADIMAERQHPMDDGEEPDDMTPDERARIDGEQLNAEIAGDRILHDKPYEISADQFNTERDEYGKEALYFYSDGVVTHENDELVDDISYLIGDTEIGHRETDTWFVRNDQIGVDYEIIYVESTYQEAVEGIETQPVDWAD